MAAPAAVLSKACSKCGDTKSSAEFPARKTSRDGLHGWCRVCYRAYYSKASREWRQQNRERARASAYSQYWSDPERFRNYQQRFRDENRALVNERAREYQARSHQGEIRAKRLDRMHRRRIATIGSAELGAWIALLLEQPCTYCGSTVNIEIDHVIPLSRGGTHDQDNLAPACRSCNRSKKDRLLSEWKAA